MEQWIEAVRKVVFLVFYGELFIHAMAGSAYQKYIRYGLGLMVLILLIQPVFSPVSYTHLTLPTTSLV